jgi:23S rRNA-/tRNA-specific pseudouridylate synthase
MTISEKNKQIIAEAFSEAFAAQSTKNEFHALLFGEYENQTANLQTDISQTQDNSTEFQKLLEHSQDFRNFAKERFEQGFTQTETDNQKK